MYAAEAGLKLIAIAAIVNFYLVLQFCPGTGFPASVDAATAASVAEQCGENVMISRTATFALAALGACVMIWGCITACAHGGEKNRRD